ncbi:MAG: hypothetical protein GY856_33280 [bacterium]|nr:hypothetical protein [bacterium]
MTKKSTPDSEDDQSSAPVSARDREIIDAVDRGVSGGRQLYDWWKKTDAENSYARRFPLIRGYHQSGHTFAFFDEAPVDGKDLPIMGVVQDLYFDQPKARPGGEKRRSEGMRRQIQEFAHHYYHRVMKLARPQSYGDLAEPELPPLLRALSWWPKKGLDETGFGAKQLYYKLKDGPTGKFPDVHQQRVIDSREVGEKYDWVALNVDFFDFGVTIAPLGRDSPQLNLHVDEKPYLVMTPEFIVNEDHPEPGILGRYGPGYAFVRAPGDGIARTGPDKVEPAFDVLYFEVDETGKTIVRSIFVIPQPKKILNLSLDPFRWGYELANLASLGIVSRLFGGLERARRKLPGAGVGFDPVLGLIDTVNVMTGDWAARELSISRDTLHKQMLFMHCVELIQVINNVMQTWSRVSDWLDTEQIPAWVRTGELG